MNIFMKLILHQKTIKWFRAKKKYYLEWRNKYCIISYVWSTEQISMNISKSYKTAISRCHCNSFNVFKRKNFLYQEISKTWWIGIWTGTRCLGIGRAGNKGACSALTAFITGSLTVALWSLKKNILSIIFLIVEKPDHPNLNFFKKSGWFFQSL